MTKYRAISSLCLLALFGCGGCGGGTSAPPIEGVPVASEGFVTYRTDHNNRNRVSRNLTDPQNLDDKAVLAGFDAGAGPAGFKDLVAINDATMTIEVIAEVTNVDGEKASRLLRITADQIPLENVRDGKLVAASGTYYFRGESFAWATIDGGPLLSGYHASGLENLVLDFGAGTAFIDLRTEINGATGSQVEIALTATGLPFNVVTGAYGGAVTIEVDRLYAVEGALRGNVGGTPTYTDGAHGMTTSGLFTASGVSDGKEITVEGVYLGSDSHGR